MTPREVAKACDHRYVPTIVGPTVSKCIKCGQPHDEVRSTHWTDHEKATGPSLLRR